LMLVILRRRAAGASASVPSLELEPRRFFANHLDFQDQLDRWAEKVDGRAQRTIRGVPAKRLADERELRPLDDVALETDRRWVARVAQQPLVRVDRK
jgi:hypothetical protein